MAASTPADSLVMITVTQKFLMFCCDSESLGPSVSSAQTMTFECSYEGTAVFVAFQV